MNVILGLSGIADSGKTTTLLRLGELMPEIGFEVQPELFQPVYGSRDDQMNIYHNAKTGKRIGIVTAGDGEEQVEIGLAYAYRNNCDYYICACRSHGATHNAIERVGGFLHLYFPKQKLNTADDAQHTAANDLAADRMLEVIKQLLKN